MTRLSPYLLTLLALVSVASGQKLPFAVGETVKGCDLFSGKWVLDETRPLYQEKDCPFLLPQLTCEAYGRPDKDYLKWRWQPNDCSLASINASLVLETLRGKRMMFVGDSINRGQFNSFVCLVHSIVPELSKSIITNKAHTVFTAKDYNATIEFFWAPFLLRSNADNPAKNVPIAERIVLNGSINTYGHHWKGVDIIIFDTYFWWGSATTFKILEGGHFNDTEKKIVELSIEDSYRLAMESMLDWVKRNMDPKMTRTFFMSMSPAHQWSREWGGRAHGNCYNETSMIQNSTFWGAGARDSIIQVMGDVLSKTDVPITLLNITQLSMYRKDAHTSIYKKQWNPITPEQQANPTSYADCIHWCVPGLPDTWNEILFTKIFYP